jgi:hypothetical protein
LRDSYTQSRIRKDLRQQCPIFERILLIFCSKDLWDTLDK